ncbi:MAG: extracellular solute-binding protein, partial [Armatimonadetes bacterium]|nr:extracellular solute-binding protein [Armatimonadota bacterium]
RVGTYLSGPWDVGPLKERASFRWDVWHLPKKKKRATMLGTENYAIMAGSKHPQEAWELLKFLLSKHAQEVMAEKQEKMPSRLSVLKGAYLQSPAEYNRRVFVDALGYAQFPPNIPEWDKVQHLMQEELDLIWIGKKPVDQGLHDAVRKVNEMLRKQRSGE